MLIVEGPDNSGKSTLIDRLKKRFPNVTVTHSGGPPQSDAEIRQRMNDLIYTHQGTASILDRIPCISEAVYGPILRGQDFFKGSPALGRLIQARVPIIYCRPPNSVLCNLETHNVREGEKPEHVAKVVRHHASIIAEYDRLFNSIPIPHLHYSWPSDANHHSWFDVLCLWLEEYWGRTAPQSRLR